jgi:enoyl-CoA hydratase/carnithine racemase
VSYQTIAVDTPAEYVARVTLNRPEKRNAISTPMRVELLDALRGHDADPDVRVTIIRGAGVCFSAGYDLGGGPMMEGRRSTRPPATASGPVRPTTPGSAFGTWRSR